MSRRMRWVVAGIVMLLLIAGATWWVIVLGERERAAIDIARLAMGKAMANELVFEFTDPKLEWGASLDGDTTILKLTIKNERTVTLTNLLVSGILLASVEPREKETLPIRVAELVPGASHEVILHFDKIQWLGDDVPKNRVDLGWAQKPLDLNMTWSFSRSNSTKRESGPVSEVKANSSSNATSNTTGIAVHLGDDQARELKKRRDEGGNAKPAK